MRTFGLVCMASAALTVFVGQARYWYGGGVGFYAAALMLAILCMVSMSLLRRLEQCLPGRATLDVSLSFCRGSMPSLDEVAENAPRSGYHIVCNSLVITYAEEMLVWRFAAVALDRTRPWRPRGWRRSAPSRKTWPASRLPLCGTDHQWRQRRTSAALTCRKASGVDGSH
jgi:hypothetical protein